MLYDFFLGNRLVCPYCLFRQSVTPTKVKCANTSCGRDIPREYREDYRKLPPLFVPLIGWSGVGKTVYLQSLTLMLGRLGRIWKKFVPVPDSEPTLRFVREVKIAMSEGRLPLPTPLEVTEAYIMLLKHMERWGGRTLVMRDCAGEHFQRFEIPEAQAVVLKNAPTVMMMFSMNELSSHPEWDMDNLLNCYLQTMLKYGVNIRKQRRNVIVVLSKCELMHDMPSHLTQYLMNDALQAQLSGTIMPPSFGAHEMAEYVERMDRLDTELKAWMETTDSGFKLVRRAADMNIQIRFTIVSSTGSEVQNNKLTTMLDPRRVLDPFFWALEFERS